MRGRITSFNIAIARGRSATGDVNVPTYLSYILSRYCRLIPLFSRRQLGSA